jgi:hypothetical protein
MLDKCGKRFVVCKISDNGVMRNRYSPREIIPNQLWVGGITSSRNEWVLRAMDITRVVILKPNCTNALRIRFPQLAEYTEHAIASNSNHVRNLGILDVARYIAGQIQRGDRIYIHETVVTFHSELICGVVLRILFPALTLPDTVRHLSYTGTFYSISGSNMVELRFLDAMRRRISALARAWVALAGRPAAAAAAPHWPALDVVHIIAALVDPLFVPIRRAVVACPQGTPRTGQEAVGTWAGSIN